MSDLSNVEALLLAQAVWELGADAWHAVAKLLSRHPLVSRPKSFFTPAACLAMYTKLMSDAHLPCNTDSSNAVHSPENLKLAQKLYQTRLEELRSLIVAEETKFKIILSEIEAMRDGRWNDQSNNKAAEVDPSSPGEEDAKVLVEILDESELSGVTESSASSHDATAEQSRGEEREQELSDKSLAQLTEAAATGVGKEYPETPSSNVLVSQTNLDVETTTEKYLQPEKEIINHEKPSEQAPVNSTPTHEALQSSLDIQSVDEFRQAHRQEEEEEEEEEEQEVIRPEEEEAEVDIETEPIPVPEEAPTSQAEVKDDMQLVQSMTEETLEVEQQDGVTVKEEDPQPVRRSRRHRSSVSTAPLVQSKGSRVRRSRRVSEATEASPVSVDDEHETNQDVDNVAEEIDHDRDYSPMNDESSTHRTDAKRKASLIDAAESPRERKRPRDESEPMEEDEPGPSSVSVKGRRRGDKTEEQVALKRFQNVIGMLHAQISQHRNGNIFHNPIKNSEAPDYHEIVKRPIDLKTIKAKVKDGQIVNSLEYQRDIYLMFANAMMYNVPGSDVYAMAEDMMLESEVHISTFRQTEGLVRRF
ncbi:hypothetical protein AX15_007635 [Amanita polypyramis BW_CC]|nr:hypothetical protein AX15_007635 [Amanita polypyramis BW_CC]